MPSRDSFQPKTKKNFNLREGFFRKSPFCTFFYINTGFGGPWVMIRKKFFIAIFIMLQKNTFGQKKFENHAILAEMKNCQNGTFEPVHEIQNFFFDKSILLNPYESGIKKT